MLKMKTFFYKNKFYIFIFFVFLLKVFVAVCFSSDYQNLMFMPFVKQFLSGIGSDDWNVYQYYYENNLISSFPYTPLMLVIECIGGWLNEVFHLSKAVSVLVFKLPSFIFDFMGLYYLVRLFPDKRRYAAVLYYASPIILYAVYMHGQLDLIPTALLFGSIFYLHREGGHKYFLSAVMFAFSFLTKTHVIVALPLILLFVWHRKGFVKALYYLCVVSVLAVVCIAPFWSEGFVRRVLLNSEQNVVMQMSLSIGDIQIFIPILAILFVYLIAYNVRTISNELLVLLTGIAFALFLSLCQPNTGWYIWVIPYITVFFILVSVDRYQNIAIYAVMNGLYLIYFLFFHTANYVDLYFLNESLAFIKIQNDTMRSILFTALCATMLYLIWQMYSTGISNNALYKRGNIPFTIGVAGDSGAGKTTFVSLMEKVLGRKNVVCLEGDGDHKWERGEKMWEQYTHLNPNANYLYRQAQNLGELRRGASVFRTEYDHDTGTFSSVHRVRAKKYIFLSGLHSLYLPQTRKNLDLKIYIDADETLRQLWKIQRDVSERGHSPEEVFAQMEKRYEDAEKYIFPQKQYADLIIRYISSTENVESAPQNVVLDLQLTVTAILNLDPLKEVLNSTGVDISFDFSNNIEQQIITISGKSLEGKQINFDRLIFTMIPDIDEITLENLSEMSNLESIVVLVTLLYIKEKIRGDIR